MFQLLLLLVAVCTMLLTTVLGTETVIQLLLQCNMQHSNSGHTENETKEQTVKYLQSMHVNPFTENGYFELVILWLDVCVCV